MQLPVIILLIDLALLLGIIIFLAIRGKVNKNKAERLKETDKEKGTKLTLKNVVKVYGEGENSVKALKGVSLTFRESEFVSILGPSGCGKTTMLNIIGGLDHYTEGDLIINGISTKEYKDRDWDSYRNHSVGFVFQSYNLIPHQTVLQNVELALTLSGVGISERKKRATEALVKVGLKDQLGKKPNQLSGGQMQRVAIARALVNNPDVILADEPTGALDTETSVQIMDILKEVAKERLVIMVTHNPDLAEQYSTRIIKMLDGEIVGDSMPCETPNIVAKNKKHQAKVKKPSMSFFTALRLSLKNLFTKKGRTVLTSFAGSIGIIGIALILAVSQGTTGYINHIQESTLASYPLTIQTNSSDLTSMMTALMGSGDKNEHEKDAVYKEEIITNLVNALVKSKTGENDLKSFKTYLEGEINSENSELGKAITGIKYGYDINPVIYTENIDGKIVKSDSAELMTKMIAQYMSGSFGVGSGNKEQSSTQGTSFMTAMNSGMWEELLPAKNGSPINDILKDQYEMVYGSWPNDYNEVVLVLNENNELDDLTLYALGLISEAEIDAIMDAAINDKELEHVEKKWSYEEVCARSYRAVLSANCYQEVGGVFVDFSTTESGLRVLYQSGIEIKVKGIIRPKESAESPMLSGAIGYTYHLTEHVIEKSKESDVVKAQLANTEIDVLTGLPFKANKGSLTEEQKKTEFLSYVNTLNEKGKAELYVKIKSVLPKETLNAQTQAVLDSYTDRDVLENDIATALAAQTGLTPDQVKGYLTDMDLAELKQLIAPMIEEKIKAEYAFGVAGSLSSLTDAQKAQALESEIPSYSLTQCALYYDEVMEFSENTLEDNLKLFGAVDLATPTTISLYTDTFENKELIENSISNYNKSVDEAKKIKYTDYVGLLMGSVTQIIDAISYVLIAFVAISLIVSSIMIGVITLISVQERTKEIGVLRAIGASKKDVSSMFNAETVIIGFSSGLLGVLVTYLLCIPINVILRTLTGLTTLKAILPLPAALILIGISMLLTLISGIIPSRSAAKKDPVVALRTE